MPVALELTDSLTFGELIVGAGTLALAGFTGYLGFQAKREAQSVDREASKVGEQVQLQREQMEAGVRPYVVPAPSRDWAERDGRAQYAADEWRRVLPVKNAGPGAALNVRGRLDFGPPTGVKVDLIPISLASGDVEDVGVHWDGTPRAGAEWDGLRGVLEYEDATGQSWRTPFEIEVRGGVRYVTTGDPTAFA